MYVDLCELVVTNTQPPVQFLHGIKSEFYFQHMLKSSSAQKPATFKNVKVFNFPHLCSKISKQFGNYVTICINDMPSTTWLIIGWWFCPFVKSQRLQPLSVRVLST